MGYYKHKIFTIEIAFCPDLLNAEDIKKLLHDELAVNSNVIEWG